MSRWLKKTLGKLGGQGRSHTLDVGHVGGGVDIPGKIPGVHLRSRAAEKGMITSEPLTRGGTSTNSQGVKACEPTEAQ